MQNFQDKIKKLVPEMRRVNQIHFIGIGGAGMSGMQQKIFKVQAWLLLQVPLMIQTQKWLQQKPREFR